VIGGGEEIDLWLGCVGRGVCAELPIGLCCATHWKDGTEGEFV